MSSSCTSLSGFKRCYAMMIHSAVALLLCSPGGDGVRAAESTENVTEPELHSLVPIGGAQASTCEIELSGKVLSGAVGTWFAGEDDLEAVVLPDSNRDDCVRLQVTIQPHAKIGPHPLRLVTPLGVSNALYFHVHAEPAIVESKPTETTRDPVTQAQVISHPAVVHGVISRQGELDYYAIDVGKDEVLAFEVILSRESLKKGFQPQLKLYDPTGSWFDPRQLTRLAFHSEVVEGDTPITTALTFRFPSAGRCLLQLGSERHKGAPDFSYALRIAPGNARYRSHGGPTPSVARVFTRPLKEDRLNDLWSRAVAPLPESHPDGLQLSATAEHEPNDGMEQAMQVPVPVLIEAVIERPGDIDCFAFTVESNQKLAFEIETSDVIPPHFSPRLELIDAAGRSLLTNLHREELINDDRWDLKRLEPKFIQTFEQPGTYTLKVRDVTSRAGNSKCQYRLLIRPQIPYVGEIKIGTLKRSFEDSRIDPYRVNLRPGEAKTVTVETSIEEIGADLVESGGTRRFTDGPGQVALLVENLPDGVRAYAGSYIENTREQDRRTVNAYNLVPDIQKTTIVLEADHDAPTMETPCLIQVIARPLIHGRPSARIVAGELPLMVIQPTVASATQTAEVASEQSDVVPEPTAVTPEPTDVSSEPSSVASETSDDATEVSAAPTEAPPDETEDSAAAPIAEVEPGSVADSRIRSLRLIPETLRLRGNGATQRFLVLANFADGLERDVTGKSLLALSQQGVVHVDDGAKLTGIADGLVELTAEFSGMSVTARVMVEDSATSRPLSFARDVGGVLTKHGCNNSQCHGSVKGKGGFKLSIGAVFPEKDYRWIVEGGKYHVMTPEVDASGPPDSRINRDNPSQSLLLLKATEAVPHEGGSRLTFHDQGYETILQWIAGGGQYGEAARQPESGISGIEVLPEELVLEPSARHGLLVSALLSGGRQDDLTDEVSFESNNPDVAEVTDQGVIKAGNVGEADIIVRAAGHATSVRVSVVAGRPLNYPTLEGRNFIDEHVFGKLRRARILPSRTSTDAEFLRRVCLDVTGTLPPPARVREFLASEDADKREQLIEVLLDTPEYVEFWTYRFSELFRVYSGATLNAEHARLHENWIHDNIAENKPYDQVARERLTAQGYDSPAWHYWTFRDITPAAEVATEQLRVFTGRRLGCAQCHDHPFENWSQDQFWGIAAFFGNMTRIADVPGMRGPYFIIDDPAGHGFRKVGRGKLIHPRTKAQVEPALLDGEVLPVEERIDPRTRLAQWMTSPDNPFFAEAIVNRTWSWFFGRGIVDPVDDFRASNPPSHPRLLAALSADFVENKYDVKHLIRTILQSRTYQLSGEPNKSNEHDEVNYARALPRLLDPPVLLDSISYVTGVDSELVASAGDNVTSGVPAGMRAISALPNDTPCPFFEAYNRNDRRGVPEDKPQLSLLRSLHRLVGATYSNGLVGKGGRLDRLIANESTDQEIIEEFYLAAVSRFPTDRERSELQRLIVEQPSRNLGLESLTWALLNAREFVYNH